MIKRISKKDQQIFEINERSDLMDIDQSELIEPKNPNSQSNEPSFAIVIPYNSYGIMTSKRHNHVKVYPGKWQPPGGKREDYETSEQCIQREFKEETGQDRQIEDFIYILHDDQEEVINTEPNPDKKGCDTYILRIPDSQKTRYTYEQDKNGPWKMISYEEFADIADKQLMTPTLNLHYKEIIQKCKEMVKDQ
jgi:8-oxo-dGTP pyrophosphatase MutT (NUDIX family)